MLTLDNLCVDLARNSVLRRVSAHLAPASTVAIVGRNGAGKTTLLRAVMGLVPIREGTIRLQTADAGETDLGSVAGHRRARLGIGYAPEERVIFPTLTVEENLRLPCEVQGLAKTDVDACLDEVVKVVPQLRDLLRRSSSALSGGQGKMVALGRALMIGTRLVLLDEPFQGLAPVLAAQYGESLVRLRRVRPGLCVVITESNASLLGGLPDQTLTLDRGALRTAADAGDDSRFALQEH